MKFSAFTIVTLLSLLALYPNAVNGGGMLRSPENVTNNDTEVPINGEEPEDDEHQWPLPINDDDTNGDKIHGRVLVGGDCGIYAQGDYFHPSPGKCYNLGGYWWNDKVTWVRASSATCIQVWEHHEGGRYKKHCGSEWLKLQQDLSKKVSRVCCPSKSISPVTTCSGNGGACGCGRTGDGKQISMNRYWGNNNDEKVWGCGGAFHLDGATWNSQWGGKLSQSSPEASVLHSLGLSVSQSASYDGWEGCCLICGYNLQIAGKISDGWYCEKDWASTGIWLKGKNK